MTERAEQALGEHFPGESWADVRAIIRAAADRGTPPTRIGFDSPFYREIKSRLAAVQGVMLAEGMFHPPRFVLVREVEKYQGHQDRLAALCRSIGMADDDPASPDLPAEITVAALGERCYPRLWTQVMDALERHGWKINGTGHWVGPARSKQGAIPKRRKQSPETPLFDAGGAR